MLNLQLITKVSAKDYQFRSKLMELIATDAQVFIQNMSNKRAQEDWASCYVLAKNYFTKIRPYLHLSYFNDMMSKVDTIKSATSVAGKLQVSANIERSVSKNLIGSKVLDSTNPPASLEAPDKVA